MKTLEDHLSQYAAYHRDGRNIVSHFFGIPMIVVGVAVLLSRPAWRWDALSLSAAVVLAVLLGLFYLRLDLAVGLLMAGLLAGSVAIGAWTAAGSTWLWLAIGIGLLVVGWIIQFVGHAWEGRKPAFIDDILGLAIGPLFIVAEALFAAGLLPELRRAVDARATRLRAASTSAGSPTSERAPS